MRLGAMTLLLAAAALGAPAVVRRWDFEGPFSGWRQPAEAGAVVADPDRAGNHVYQITATRAHHTQLILEGSDSAPDFVASVRFRLQAHEGALPTVYVYGRLQGQFRGLTVQDNGARAFCYFGQDKPAVEIGTAGGVGLADGQWVRARFACFGEHVFAKVWPDGRREPRWQMAGQCAGPAEGRFALGVWTSPRTPSQAAVWFDDITFAPLAEADLAGLGLRIEPRPGLDPSVLGDRTGVVELGGDIGLATPTCALMFDPGTGGITHLVDRATGQEFVEPSLLRPLFRLELTQPFAGKRLEVSADEFAETVVASAGPTALTWRFGEHDGLPLGVEVKLCTDAAGLLRFAAVVTNDSDWAIARVDLPVLAFPACLGTSQEDDVLVLPWADGAILPAPGARTQSRSAVYPGDAFTQFTALYDPTAGLYLATDDTEGHGKRWTLQATAGRSVAMGLSHLRPEVPRVRVELPYQVVLGTFHGDWRDAADIYRAWAEKQWWCARRLRERDDIPAFLKDGAGVVIASVNNPAGREALLGADLERLPGLVAAYRKRTGLAHVVFVPYGWENRGTWAGINYLPAVPSDEAWIKANEALQAQGDRTAFLTSGYWWVIKRQKTGDGPAFDDSAQFEQRKDMVIWKPDGTPFLADYYDSVGQFGDWRGLSAALCHGSAAARAQLLETFLGVAQLGVPLVSFDQEIGGGQSAPCYSAKHGHPPGYGSWMWTGFRDLCAEILQRGKPLRPELGLFIENVSELAIPWLSTYWSRQFGEVDHGAIGARGVGLFSYLYHDYVTAIGAACVQGQGLHGTRPHPGLRRYVLANNLVRGLIPGPFLHEAPLEPRDAWQRETSPAFFSYCQPYARFAAHVLLGKTVRPPAVECASVDLWFYRQDPSGAPLKPGGPNVVKVPVTLPVAVAGRFEAADGSLGTVVANTTADAQDVELTFAPGTAATVVFSADGQELERLPPGPGPVRVRLALPPLGTRVVVQR